jgi:hypothetical protein
MFLLRTLAAITAFAAASGLIKDCDTASRFRPTELAVSPDPPVRGQPVAMTVKFDNPGPVVDDGTVTTSIMLNFIPFQPSSEPLCQNTACPIPNGAADRSTSSIWPDTVSGRVVTKSVWTGSGGESLLCVQSSFSVASASNLRGALNLTEEFNATVANLWHDDLSAKQVAAWRPSLHLQPTDLEYSNMTCPATNLYYF